jgi:hypothetical protein
LPARHFEHRFRRRVRERDTQRSLVEHEHDRGQRFEARQQTGLDELHIVRQRVGMPFSGLDQVLQYHLAVG